MADRIFNLPQTRGSFEMAGKVTGTQRSNFYNEKETKSGAMRRVLSFGVQTSNENTFYIDLAGMPRDKVYFFRRADKDKGIEKDKKEVAWKDRLTYVAPEGYDMIGVKVGVTKKTNESGKVINDNKTLTDFDAAKEISENLHDGDNVYVRGNIEYSTYNGKHQIRFVPTQVSLSSKEIDFDATKNQTLEIDFQALVSNEKVHSVAEIVLHNTENVVEGVLEQILKEVSYKAYPSALVDKIDVDCGNLHLGDCIRVKDLEIAKNKDISIMTNPESIIVNVIAVHNNAGDDTADDTEETAEK